MRAYLWKGALRLMERASSETLDARLLAELDSLMKRDFPRTVEYISKKISSDAASGLTEEIMTVAWVEARALDDGTGASHVPGRWTEREISDEINECFRIARGRVAG